MLHKKSFSTGIHGKNRRMTRAISFNTAKYFFINHVSRHLVKEGLFVIVILKKQPFHRGL